MADAREYNTDGPVIQSPKLTHTLVLDSSPLLLNTPSLSTLLSNSTILFTTYSVIAEIKDKEARDRIESLYQPFITLRQPKLENVKVVREFAQKTGDIAVLSRTDIEVLALAYELECERNGGDWRLRRTPGQKRLNGSPPKKEERAEVAEKDAVDERDGDAATHQLQEMTGTIPKDLSDSLPPAEYVLEPVGTQSPAITQADGSGAGDRPLWAAGSLTTFEELSSDSDSADWITPSNIKKRQAKEDAASHFTKIEIKTLQVATITGDFAMQNVLLQMNLNLLSPATCKRIAHIKQTILRCHGCFATTKDMTKRFCPRCGNPTLTRVSCTTNDKGEVKLHLKANMQWNNKGNVFSIPKPVAGSANQKWKGPRQGGGKEGWGNGLILAEDQKEYIWAMSSNSRDVRKDLMDEDYLPSILTGDRNRGSGRVRVGAGRNVNSKK